MSWFCSEVYKNISSNTNGHWKPCCIGKRVNDMKLEDTKFLDFFNSEELNQLRKDQEEGNFSELVKNTCGKCISDEANGVVSRRQYSNVKYSNSDLSSLEFESIKVKHIGNLCNQKCVMCSPSASSALALEAKNHFGWEDEIVISSKPTETYLEGLKEVLPYTKSVKFVGGEPLINPMTWEFIDWLCQQRFFHLNVHFTSNCSRLISSENLKNLNQFKSISILASVDALGERCEYIRYPMNFEKCIKNAKTFINQEINVNFTSCVSIVNFGYMGEFLSFLLKEFNSGMAMNMVNFPTILSPKNIPTEIKKSYQLPSKDLEFIRDAPPDLNLFKQGLIYLKSLDEIRGNNLFDFCPEFEKYYEQ